jgi:hypothetical protein
MDNLQNADPDHFMLELINRAWQEMRWNPTRKGQIKCRPRSYMKDFGGLTTR